MNEKELYLIKRRRKKIKQSDIAKVLNCSQSLISRYEKGDCTMSQTKIERYKEIINKY